MALTDSDMPQMSLAEATADAALALELLRAFFANQVEAGAAPRDGVAQLIRDAGNTVADRFPFVSHHITERAMHMANALPEEGTIHEW